jgi:hypothetical protein
VAEMAAKNNFVVDLMRDVRISTFIVSFITRGSFVSLWYFKRVFMSTLMPLVGRRREREKKI